MSKFYKEIVSKNKFNHLPCPQAWTTNFLFANGNITCCTQNSTSLGNLETEGLDKIWNSVSAQKIRSDMLAGNYLEAGCDAECPFLRGSYKPVINPPKIEELIPPDMNIPDNESEYSENVNKVLNDYLAQKTVCDGLPIFTDVFWLEKCNAACIQCNQDHNSSLIISDNLIAKIYEIAQYSNYLRFQGGEVFADPNFYPFFLKLSEQQKNQHLTIYLITNGAFLNDRILEQISINASKYKILLSIDAVNKNTFEKIRKNLKYDRVVNVIYKLSKIRKEKKLDVVLNYCVMKSNLNELVDACIFSKKYDIPINFAAIQGNYGFENFFYDSSFHLNAKKHINNALNFANQNLVQYSGFDGLLERLNNATPGSEYSIRNSRLNPISKKISFFSRITNWSNKNAI